MSNMSYCKWENTAADMEQCLAEGEHDFADPTNLDDHELNGMKRCFAAAAAMLEEAPDWMMDELGIERR